MYQKELQEMKMQRLSAAQNCLPPAAEKTDRARAPGLKGASRVRTAGDVRVQSWHQSEILVNRGVSQAEVSRPKPTWRTGFGDGQQHSQHHVMWAEGLQDTSLKVSISLAGAEQAAVRAPRADDSSPSGNIICSTCWPLSSSFPRWALSLSAPTSSQELLIGSNALWLQLFPVLPILSACGTFLKIISSVVLSGFIEPTDKLSLKRLWALRTEQ